MPIALHALGNPAYAAQCKIISKISSFFNPALRATFI